MKTFLLGIWFAWILSFLVFMILDCVSHIDEDTIAIIAMGPVLWIWTATVKCIIRPLQKLWKAYWRRGIIHSNGQLYWVSSSDFAKIMYGNDSAYEKYIISNSEYDEIFKREGWHKDWWGDYYINGKYCSLRYAPKQVWSKYPKFTGDIEK